jgi:hypothetical protein
VSFAGTEISGDLTSLTFSQTADMADVTAQNETVHYYIPLDRTDGECTVEGFWAGTANFNVYELSSVGTLIVAPAGTASTKHKYTCNRAIVTQREQSIPFDEGVTVSVTFQLSAALTQGTY